MRRGSIPVAGVLLTVSFLCALALAAEANQSLFDAVFFFEDPSSVRDQRRWLLSLFNATTEVAVGAGRCTAVLPPGRTTYYAAQWSPGTSSCVVAFDQRISPSAWNIAPGGFVNMSFVSSLSGSRLRVLIECSSSATAAPTFPGPFTGSRAPGGQATIHGYSSFLCLQSTAPHPSSPSASHDDKSSWWLVVIAVLGVAVVALIISAWYVRWDMTRFWVKLRKEQ